MAQMMCPLTQMPEWTFLLLLYVSAGVSELICPSVGYLDSPANLTCISSSNVTSHGYTTSQGETAAICNVLDSSCNLMGDYRASTINQTHSLLTIPAVQPVHAGEWKCHTPCNLTVVKLPVCSMTHHVTDPDTVEGVSPEVNIRGYYCSELAQLKISTGDNVTEYPNEKVTNITDRTVHINKTDASFGTEVIFTCGQHRWNISCNLENREEITVQSSDQTSPSSPVKKIGRNYIVTGVVVLVVLPITIIIIRCLRRRTMNQKAPPVLECPDPPYVEVQQGCNNKYASVENLSLQGRASMEHSCAVAYAVTGFYEAVGDKSAPKTRKDDARVLVEAGGYSTVAARNAEEAYTQNDGPSCTALYETVGNKRPREYGAKLGVQPVVFDVAGYSTVGDFSPRPSDGSLGHLGKQETVLDLKESRKTNRLSELYAKVNKKKGTPGLVSSDVTSTSGM